MKEIVFEEFRGKRQSSPWCCPLAHETGLRRKACLNGPYQERFPARFRHDTLYTGALWYSIQVIPKTIARLSAHIINLQCLQCFSTRSAMSDYTKKSLAYLYRVNRKSSLIFKVRKRPQCGDLIDKWLSILINGLSIFHTQVIGSDVSKYDI